MSLRPDLNGQRFTRPSDGAVFLVDEGQLRHIPNQQTYAQMFRNWNGIQTDEAILSSVQVGPPYDIATKIVAVEGKPHIYLLTYGAPGQVIKRHVTDWDTMDHYNFADPREGGTGNIINPSQDASIPEGSPISFKK